MTLSKFGQRINLMTEDFTKKDIEILKSALTKLKDFLIRLDSFTIEELENNCEHELFLNLEIIIDELLEDGELQIDEDGLISWAEGY